MLEITIRKEQGCYEAFDPSTNEFCKLDKLKKDVTLSLEHSLVSISKWECKWHKPFLSETKKTNEELLDYIKCMTITQNVDDSVFDVLISDYENIKKINSYIEDKMSATVFTSNIINKNQQTTHKKETMTNEIIYYWMIYFNIPMECQRWHLNRLLTLIRVCQIKESNEKMSKKDTMLSNAALNKARRARLNSKG